MLQAAMTFFLACLGACIGSFLNVVIYRLPRGMSVSQPRRSFCPACERQIEWYDNVPIISWIVLRGKCRYCSQPISLQYPLIELAGVVVTMLVWHAARGYCTDVGPAACGPMVVGLLGLFYCLLGLSAMDLKEYYVDIRLTWLALLIGLVCQAISPAEVWPAGAHVGAGWGAFAVGCVIALIVLDRTWPVPEERPVEVRAEEPDAGGQPDPEVSVSQQRTPTSPIVLIVLLGLAAAGLVAAEAASGLSIIPLGRWPVVAGVAILFISILAGSWLPTEADAAIAEAVESERSLAMREAVREAAILVICVLVGLSLKWLVQPGAYLSTVWTSCFSWSPWEGVRPIAGVLTALAGWVIAGGACWFMRVVFTLVFRKEALGFGDIHIIAAVGSVAGPAMAITGFFLAAPVALVGTAVLMFRKNYRTLPFGPWLSIGFLLAVLWGRELVVRIDTALEGLRMALG